MIGLILFWGALTLIFYGYVIFPLLVWLYGLIRHRPYKSAEITPHVSVIIAAHNEAGSIAARLDNLLALEYPRDHLEVLIASDGSTDDTDAIVRSYTNRGITLLALPRQGKIPALNTAAAAATGEILVFSDANSVFAPDALRYLVMPFADSQIGGVAGNQKYLVKRGIGGTIDGERGYWNFDRILKRSQSRAGNVISATGSIYAIRRSLFHPIPPGVTDDFVTSTSVIVQGYRLVFAPDALAYEPVAQSSDIEFGRKVRVTTQGLRAVLVMSSLLNPFRYGFYAIQVISHKVIRRLMVFPLLGLFFVNPLLWNRGVFYQVTTLLQLGFYGCAILGMLLRRSRLGRLKVFSIPFFFCMVYAASLLATVNILRGRRIELWEPQRKETSLNEVALQGSLSVPPERSSP
ncbi:MAG TPA: glycosyltransferase family 2 protein [Anaerolineales bacterium]|nr:glycosyltransferase family 2 protein [Anaerolineales bacterium]